jgi:hypothetical protein
VRTRETVLVDFSIPGFILVSLAAWLGVNVAFLLQQRADFADQSDTLLRLLD